MATDRLRALIVDDEEIIRNLMRFVMEQEGFDADDAENGEIALEKYSEHRYDLIVTDLSMPHFNGHLLVLKLLAKKDRPVIVVHTSFNEPRLARYMLDNGVDDIVLKPANYDFFAAKLRGLVLRHQATLASVESEADQCDNAQLRVPMVIKSQQIEPNPVSSFLPLVSPVALSVYKLTQRMEATVDEIVDEIEKDNYLTRELLRLGNQTERRGDRIECKDITQLLCRFGTRRTGELALVASVNLYSF